MKKNKNKDILEDGDYLDMMAFGGMLNPATIFDVSSDLLATTTGNAVTQTIRSLREGERERRLTTKNTGAVMANGGEVGSSPVEVEGGEMMQTPDGMVAEIEGPKHEQGGVKTELPNGTKIYSDRLKVNGETMAIRKEKREARINKLAKLLEKSPKDKLIQESFDRTKTLNEAEELKDMEYQEATTNFFEGAESMGLVPEMKNGGFVNFNTGDGYLESALQKRAYGGKVYANGTPPEGVYPTSFKTNEDVNNLIKGLYGKVNPDNVKKLQQTIVDSGYNLKGGADGVVGSATRGFFGTPESSNVLTSLLAPGGNTMTGVPTTEGDINLGNINAGVTSLASPEIQASTLPNFFNDTEFNQLGTLAPLNTEGDTTLLNPGEQLGSYNPTTGEVLNTDEKKQQGMDEFAALAKDLNNVDPSYLGLPDNFGNLPLEQQTIALQQLGIITPSEGGDVKQSGNLLDKAKGMLENIGIGGQGEGEEGDLGLTRGDLMGLAGNIQGKYGPLAATLMNRLETPDNVNMFREFGADALRAQEEAIGLAATNRDKNLQDVQLRENAMRARGRNTARGVNTMRGLDIAADMQSGKGEQGAYNAYANQMMQLLGQKSSLENVQDQMVMKGEQGRDLADRQDIDNFYTNLAQNFANISEFTQKTGRDLNQAIYNQDFLSAANMMSQYGVQVVRENGKIKFVHKGNKQEEIEEKKQKAKNVKANINAGTSGTTTYID